MEFNGSVLVQCAAGVTPHAGAAQPMTFHCQQCNSVLGDSLGVCGEVTCLDAIMCLRVTDDVVVGDAVESRHKGEMANCIFSSLKCRCCRSALGKVIHSAPARLAAARSLFLLSKANIQCYILNSSSMVDASTLSFDQNAIGENVKEVKTQFEERLDQMSHLKRRLSNRSRTNRRDK